MHTVKDPCSTMVSPNAPDGAVRDIRGLLEAGGVKILLLDTKRDSFFGLSIGQADGGPAVVVNTWDRISVEDAIRHGEEALAFTLRVWLKTVCRLPAQGR